MYIKFHVFLKRNNVEDNLGIKIEVFNLTKTHNDVDDTNVQ